MTKISRTLKKCWIYDNVYVKGDVKVGDHFHVIRKCRNLTHNDCYIIVNSSLDSLVKNLGNDDFKYLSQEFDSNILDLVKQKEFYPDGYMSGFEKFDEKLPDKENFYSSLINKEMGDKDYEHVVKVWSTFEMKTMGDYHDLYLKCRTLLLAEIFRKNSFKNYGLSLNHYLSAPA